MNIGIVGGGMTGLSAAYYLARAGHDVSVFEKEPYLGGLAAGFKEKGWDWHLERSYHHFFTNDDTIITLMHELGIADKIITKRPITATLTSTEGVTRAVSRKDQLEVLDARGGMAFRASSRTSWRGRNHRFSCLTSGETGMPTKAQSSTIFQLDSPANLLTFPYLSPIDKARTAGLLAFLKLNPFWRPLENITAEDFFKAIGGHKAWETLWQPLMTGKFGEYRDKVAASWLWARIKKRTPSLCYIEGGFQMLVNTIAAAIRSNKGKIYTNVTISSIHNDRTWTITDTRKRKSHFDAVILTVPTQIAMKLISFPPSYTDPLLGIPHLWAQTLILETDKPILNDVYWLNVNDRSFPFLAAVAHTNFMHPSHYAGHHLTYFGNYLPKDHPYLSMTKGQLLKLFLPYIKQLSREQFMIHNSFQFNAPFAQPVHELHYSSRAPKLQTPFTALYLANLDSIYPWDRGTNYAVELGLRAAKTILS